MCLYKPAFLKAIAAQSPMIGRFRLILCYFTVHTSATAKNNGVSNLCLKKVFSVYSRGSAA